MAFGYLLTQEAQARECHSFLSSCSQFETRHERGGKIREGCWEELTGPRQTQRMAVAVDPRCPPLCRKNTYTSFLLKRRNLYTEDYIPKLSRCKRHILACLFKWTGAALSGRGCPTPPSLLFLSVFWHQKEQRKSKAPKGFPQC